MHTQRNLLLTFISVLLSVLFITSCSVNNSKENDIPLSTIVEDSTSKNSGTKGDNYIIESVINSFDENLFSQKDNYTMFSEDNYYYYIFKIGQMQYIPISIDQIYYYDGNSVKELEFSTSKLDLNLVRQKVQRQVESHTEWSKTLAVPNLKLKSIELGSIYTNYEFGSADYFEINEKEGIDGTANLSSTVLREKFDSNRPEGNWAYVFFATVDVYASITTDKNHNVLDTSIQTKIVNGNFDFQFLGKNTDITDYTVGEDFKINLESDSVKKIITQIPKIDITGQYDVINDGHSLIYCGKDKDYVPQSADNNMNIVEPNILQISIKNVLSNNSGEYILKDNEDPILNVKLIQDIYNIKTNKNKSKSELSVDGAKKVSAFGSLRTISSKAGLGAVLAQINYKNNEVSIIDATNLFKGVNVPETVDLFRKLNLTATELSLIKSIDFVLFYEIKTTSNGQLIPVYTNWRYNFTVAFSD